MSTGSASHETERGGCGTSRRRSVARGLQRTATASASGFSQETKTGSGQVAPHENDSRLRLQDEGATIRVQGLEAGPRMSVQRSGMKTTARYVVTDASRHRQSCRWQAILQPGLSDGTKCRGRDPAAFGAS